eukprot:5248949-Alexandrium_andersonii.AAC.1
MEISAVGGVAMTADARSRPSCPIALSASDRGGVTFCVRALRGRQHCSAYAGMVPFALRFPLIIARLPALNPASASPP